MQRMKERDKEKESERKKDERDKERKRDRERERKREKERERKKEKHCMTNVLRLPFFFTLVFSSTGGLVSTEQAHWRFGC